MPLTSPTINLTDSPKSIEEMHGDVNGALATITGFVDAEATSRGAADAAEASARAAADTALGRLLPPVSKQVERNSVTSAGNDFLTKALIGARVIGARPGYYYRIGYFPNGDTTLTPYRDGWIVEEQAIATFGTTETNERLITYTDPAPNIPRVANSKQTVRVESPSRTGFAVVLTLDIAALPAFGTPINMLTSSKDGYSWIIDPRNYEYESTSGAIVYAMAASGDVTMAFSNGGRDYRVTMGPNGLNSLPNIKRVESAAAGSTPATLWNGTTDWLPPIAFEAVSGGDGGALIYTGGNHGSNGDATGSVTGANVLYDVLIDGERTSFAVRAGVATRLRFRIVNDLYASNTISLARYGLRQFFTVDVTAAGIEVHARHEALEAITIRTDNGLQAVATGFNTEQMFLGGQYAGGWRAYSVAETSGAKATYPNAWAVLLRSATDFMVMWMDRSFGAGVGANVGAAQPYFRGSGTKTYAAVVANASLSLADEAAYEWRGGYSFGGRDVVSASRFAAVWSQVKEGRAREVFVETAQKWAALA